ncbi:SDR family oxidoreductase [Synechococcus sp. CS-1328]|uniref:SDR family oxidoreductase n=1 Tax=Synechococcus sp. CS-1328 TaxID=2847976 RepID=UPI00223AC1D3|nr:SDR family oxidoreductase [Synechococcus sp. CS-1328]MCT0223787.1 SDR family oxidoreductase [Synechococcus sp. CS-1328]
MSGLPLQGRVALVTGGGRRTGRAIALALADAGADVVVHYRHSEAEAREAVEEVERLGRRGLALPADLADAEATAAAFAAAVEQLGRLDILVNNAAGIVWKALGEMDVADWHRSIDDTLHITYHACRAALPWMRHQGFGRIVNLIDVDADALMAVPMVTPYKIGKTGVLQLTRTLAVTEAPHGITVNGVSPGTLENSERKPPLERIPAGRYGRTEEVARAVLFLADPASGYISGSNIKVSGGYLI